MISSSSTRSLTIWSFEASGWCWRRAERAPTQHLRQRELSEFIIYYCSNSNHKKKRVTASAALPTRKTGPKQYRKRRVLWVPRPQAADAPMRAAGATCGTSARQQAPSPVDSLPRHQQMRGRGTVPLQHGTSAMRKSKRVSRILNVNSVPSKSKPFICIEVHLYFPLLFVVA